MYDTKLQTPHSLFQERPGRRVEVYAMTALGVSLVLSVDLREIHGRMVAGQLAGRLSFKWYKLRN